jgi:hypothetical protein
MRATASVATSALLLLLFSSCGGSNSILPEPPLTAPPPSGQPGTVEEWVAIERSRTCQPEDSCQEVNARFMRDGSFVGQAAAGQIAREDLAELTEEGDRVARQDLPALAPACEDIFRIPELRSSELFVELKQAQARVRVIGIQPPAEQRCVIGEKDLADRLEALVDRLILKYLP